jgi:hypothetical protein
MKKIMQKVMKRITNIALLLLLGVISATAETVGRDKALRAAGAFVSTYTAEGLRSSSALSLEYTAMAKPDGGLRSAADIPLFYVYNVNDEGGFVIISADDCATPVLAYSDKGRFQAEAMPDNLRNWLLFYESEISRIILRGDAPSAEALTEWDRLLNAPAAHTPVVLLSTAKWDQEEPFNDLCPLDDGKRSYTGCVATAMGIVMKYNQWPQQGVGSHSYTTKTTETPLTADFNVAYDYANMPDVYDKRWNDTQRNAVATLLYHCGVASNMDYTSKASGTNEWYATQAMIEYFGYDKSLCMVYRPLYTTDEWNKLLSNELNSDRPILYGGVTKDNQGHQFTLDGYDAQNYFHVNWGWGGYCDGYYLLSGLDPQPNGNGKDGAGYALEQDAVIGLRKPTGNRTYIDNELYFLDEGEGAFKVYGLRADKDTILQGKPFKLYHSYVYDYGMRDFNGQMGFWLVDSDGDFKEELKTFPNNLPATFALYDNEGTSYTITSQLREGDKIRMYYRPTGYGWKPVRGPSGTVTELPTGIPSPPTSAESLAKQSPSQTNVSISPDGTLIHITSSDGSPLLSVRLFDLSGRLIKAINQPDKAPRLSIPSSNIPSGVYIVSIQTPNGLTDHKIIKR